ncbi:hypothetical protein [Curtobacterium flaccumfaciens]|uniref:hypothetical protein n=1 Tax=Curtobacterium flaccumfaciens TaxID=2035 RepID=UPI00188CDBDA|nr:hypothetical protein [Curtobacterium flaccumfaciens]MBF4629321.1 hypothetical protein [Curtobacterium flaccumfaciens]
MAVLPVSVQLSLGKYPCESCTTPMWWVLWMRAVSRKPAGWDTLRRTGLDDEDDPWGSFDVPVIIDQPEATRAARDLLRQSDLDGRARQLVDRAPGLRGASYNPNRCAKCRHVADWYALEGHVLEAAARPVALWKPAPLPVPAERWDVLLTEQHTLWGF